MATADSDSFGTFDIKIQIQVYKPTTLKFTAWSIAPNAGYDSVDVIQGRPNTVSFESQNVEHIQLLMKQSNRITFPPMLFSKPIYWQHDKIRLKRETAALLFHLIIERRFLVGSKLVPISPQAEPDTVSRQKLTQLEATAQTLGIGVLDLGPKSKDRPH
jgi:hypothetical protein